MQISSNAFQNNGSIPMKYTCDGEGISVPLEFSDVPGGAKSLVLIMDDPDVPKNLREDGMWDHWVVWNIPPETRAVAEGSEPAGVHGITTSNTKKYVRPCPPDSEHRYFFKLFALDAMLDLPEGSTKKEVLQTIAGHVIAEAELVGKYNRKH